MGALGLFLSMAFNHKLSYGHGKEEISGVTVTVLAVSSNRTQ